METQGAQISRLKRIALYHVLFEYLTTARYGKLPSLKNFCAYAWKLLVASEGLVVRCVSLATQLDLN